MKKVVFATLVAFGCTSSAFAVTTQSGVYVGALGGWSFADAPTQTEAQATSNSTQNYTYGATLGYDYALTPNWMVGIEGSYLNFGNNTYDNSGLAGNTTKLSNYGWQLMATGSYLMDNGFNAFGKLGSIHEKTKIDQQPFAGTDMSISKRLPAAAIGVGYMPMQNLNIALQYEHTFGSNWDVNSFSSTPKPITQNAVTLGATYKFAL